MSWEERPLEKHIHEMLTCALSNDGEKLWSDYVTTRNDVVDKILPHIAKIEPNLTDHSENHVIDVIDNAAILLGLKNELNEKHESSIHPYSAYEMLALLLSLVMHDVGNILKRNDHNSKIPDVWSKLTSWNLWAPNERNVVIDICRAHSGKSKDCSSDTIKDLAVSRRYFFKKPIRIAELAAIVRFADELAEGEHRTSCFLIEAGLINESSRLFHEYARCTRVAIDREVGRVALTYNIDIGDTKPNKVNLKKLLKIIYERALKLNEERQLARYYVDCFNRFRETSISLQIERRGRSVLQIPPAPLILNEMRHGLHGYKAIEGIDKNYQISALIKAIG